MKITTDLQQSEELKKIVPITSADMYYMRLALLDEYGPTPYAGKAYTPAGEIPCWSLSALMDLLPQPLEVEGHSYDLHINKESDSSYYVYYSNNPYNSYIDTSNNQDLIGACVEMLRRLKELNLI